MCTGGQKAQGSSEHIFSGSWRHGGVAAAFWEGTGGRTPEPIRKRYRFRGPFGHKDHQNTSFREAGNTRAMQSRPGRVLEGKNTEQKLKKVKTSGPMWRPS